MMEEDKVVLTFTKDEAIVLFELASRFTDTDELSIQDRAEESVLWSICARLEKVLAEPFDPNWNEILQHARDKVRMPEL